MAHDDLVASREGEALELVRAQETELPQALKWQVARADEDYDAALVEARRITVDTTRIASESFPMAIPPEEAERRCRRALMEAWIGRESATFRLPPSRLALDPADVIWLTHDSREVELRLVSIADSDGRGIEAVRQDRAAYDLPPGDPRPASLTRSVVFGAPDVLLLDLPQLSEDQPAHRPMVAAHAVPWPGEMAVYRGSRVARQRVTAEVRRRLPRDPRGLRPYDTCQEVAADLPFWHLSAPRERSGIWHRQCSPVRMAGFFRRRILLTRCNIIFFSNRHRFSCRNCGANWTRACGP